MTKMVPSLGVEFLIGAGTGTGTLGKTKVSPSPAVEFLTDTGPDTCGFLKSDDRGTGTGG